MKAQQKVRISKITVAHLFNTGNYEHTRYELTIEIPEGNSAQVAILGAERILCALNPRKLACVVSESDLKRAELRLIESVKMGDEEWNRNYRDWTGTRGEILERLRKSLEEDRAKRQKALDAQRRARELFDDLGGAAVWKDAKLDWENDQYEP